MGKQRSKFSSDQPDQVAVMIEIPICRLPIGAYAQRCPEPQLSIEEAWTLKCVERALSNMGARLPDGTIVVGWGPARQARPTRLW